MGKETIEIDLIKKELIDKINSSNLDTLLAMKVALEKPQAEIFEIFSAEKLKDKELWKWEIKIAKDLLKFMKSIYDGSKKNTALSEEQRKTFSPKDPAIKEILDKSNIIKKIGLNAWIKNLNDMDVQIWFMDIWVRKMCIVWNGNLFLWQRD